MVKEAADRSLDTQPLSSVRSRSVLEQQKKKGRNSFPQPTAVIYLVRRVCAVRPVCPAGVVERDGAVGKKTNGLQVYASYVSLMHLPPTVHTLGASCAVSMH